MVAGVDGESGGAANPEWVWQAVELIPNEKGFVLKWQAQIPTENGAVTTTGVDIIEIQADKITRNEVYCDPSCLGDSVPPSSRCCSIQK